jgi:DNA polymerase elongation subunit (family B)
MRVVSIRSRYVKNIMVYDLETDTGDYAVTAANVLVKNTDSVYVLWRNCGVEEAFHLSSQAAKKATDRFRRHIVLEHEKIMKPLALYSKKRYSYVEWLKPENPEPGVQHKGVQLVRRDTCRHVRDVLTNLTNTMFFDTNDRLIEASRRAVHSIINGDVPLDHLILSRMLKANYKSQNIAHVKLAERMLKRNDVDQVDPGERVSYIIVEGQGPMYERAETLRHVKDNNLSVDFKQYFESQLQNPLNMMLSLFSENPVTLYTDILEKSEKKRKKERDVAGFLRLFGKRD